MTFTVKERLLLLNTLNQAQGDITALRLIRKFLEALSFSEEEHALLKFKITEAGATWDEKADVPAKEIQVGSKLLEVIKKALNHVLDQMNKDPKGQPLQLFEIFDKFFPED